VKQLFLLPFLFFLGCDNSKKSKTKEENLSREELYPDANFSDCYSLNREQCELSECQIWETNRFDEWYGTEKHSAHIYDKDNDCMDMNSSSVFIGCFESDISLVARNDVGSIFRNTESGIYIHVNDYLGDILEKYNDRGRLKDWVRDEEVEKQLVDINNYIPEETYFSKHSDRPYTKYCGWEAPDCYALEKDECLANANVCDVYETDTFMNGWYGINEDTYVYDRENFCMDMNNSPVFISCIHKSASVPTNNEFGISDISVFQNKITKEYIAINESGHFIKEYPYGKIGEWEYNREAWEEMIDYYDSLPPEELFNPIPSYGDNHWYPKYCGWEPNTSKEIK
jgi:hypothetical protein